VIAGSAFGATSPVAVYSRLFYIHADIEAGATVPMPDDYTEKAIYVVSGAIEVDGKRYGEHQMIVLADGSSPAVGAAKPSRLMLLGGEPLGERHIWWNFVSTSRERIEQAKADWREQRFNAIPDESEFIPLPEK
jgi:redox-sensitive bicupin YhaK (pirin superfamily)